MATAQMDLLGPAQTYAGFKKQLQESGCRQCPELSKDRHHIVVDRGNPNTDIVVIGEAPGQNEDLQGAAFVGRAGQLLDKILESVGLNTNTDLLICNVVKCRPPGNRAPTPEEAQNCFSYLEWQLNAVKPKIVLLLGATAAKHFMKHQKNTNMRDLVGKIFDIEKFPGVKFLLLYHPAYLLRDPRKKKDMSEHIQCLTPFINKRRTVQCKP